jgi:hypothetical protein
MYLRLPFSGARIVDFDVATGTFSEVRNAEGERSFGTAGIVDEQVIALYAKEGVLFIQVGLRRWRLDEVSVSYAHIKHDKKTIFNLTCGDASLELIYPAWWSVIPNFEPVEPEMDADEDYLGYLYEVFSNKRLQQNLINSWG